MGGKEVKWDPAIYLPIRRMAAQVQPSRRILGNVNFFDFSNLSSSKILHLLTINYDYVERRILKLQLKFFLVVKLGIFVEIVIL